MIGHSLGRMESRIQKFTHIHIVFAGRTLADDDDDDDDKSKSKKNTKSTKPERKAKNDARKKKEKEARKEERKKAKKAKADKCAAGTPTSDEPVPGKAHSGTPLCLPMWFKRECTFWYCQAFVSQYFPFGPTLSVL